MLDERVIHILRADPRFQRGIANVLRAMAARSRGIARRVAAAGDRVRRRMHAGQCLEIRRTSDDRSDFGVRDQRTTLRDGAARDAFPRLPLDVSRNRREPLHHLAARLKARAWILQESAIDYV